MLHMYQLFQSMKKFITHVEKFSEESRAVSKLVWIWLEGAERGDFLRVYGVWGGCGGQGQVSLMWTGSCILWTFHGHQRGEQVGFLISFPRCGTQGAKKWWGLKAVIKCQKWSQTLYVTPIFSDHSLLLLDSYSSSTPKGPAIHWSNHIFSDLSLSIYYSLILKLVVNLTHSLTSLTSLCLCPCSYFLGKNLIA